MFDKFFTGLIWQSLGTFLTIVVTMSGVIRYFVTRNRKSLSYNLISDTPIINRAARGKVEVLFEGQNVEDVNLALITISNTGNTPIPSHDFEVPLSLRFRGESCQILSAEIAFSSPKPLKDVARLFVQIPNEVVIHPTLFNKGDSITISALLRDFSGDVRVTGRIVGITDIAKRKEPSSVAMILVTIFAFILAVIGFIILGHNQPPAPPIDWQSAWPGLVFFIIGMFVSSFNIGRLVAKRLRLQQKRPRNE